MNWKCLFSVVRNSKIVILVYILSLCVFTNNPLNAQKRYIFQNYSTRDGLINNGVYAINQDQKGYIWFATAGGVSRFDGYRFDNNVIPEINKNGASSSFIEKNKSGNLVITSMGQGLFVEQPNGSFKQFLAKKPGIGKNITRNLKYCGDRLLVSSGSIIYSFENNKFSVLNDCKCGAVACNTLESDKNGNIWFGGLFGLAVIFSGDTSHTPFYIPELREVFIMSILFVTPNELYVGTQNGFYVICFQDFRNNQLKYSVSQPISELKESYINQIYKDQQSNVWISTNTNGVYKTKNQKVSDHISVENGLANSNVMLTFQDREGNYWFATSNGISKLSSFSNYGFTCNGKMLSGVTSITSDKFNRIWAWNEADLFIIRGTQVEQVSLAGSPFETDGIYGLQISENGSLYIWNSKGLYLLPVDQQKLILKNAQLKIDFVRHKIGEYFNFYEDKNQTLIIGSTNGIFAYHDNKVNKCKFLGNENISIRPLCIEKDDEGYFWTGDPHMGLYRMKLVKSDDNTLNFDQIKVYKCAKPDSSFVTVYLGYVYNDHQGNIWISSFTNGIYKLKVNKQGVTGYTSYSIKNGLSGNYINQMVCDNNKNLWLTTKNGANCILQQKNGRDTILVFNSKDGLGDEVLNIFVKDSLVYLSYAEGLFVINSSELINREIPPPAVTLTNISVLGEPDSLALVSRKPYILQYNQNFISFDYSAITFIHEKGIKYQVMLEGLDKSWNMPTEHRFISYNSLSPGTYLFKVRAISDNGLMSEKVTTFAFKIRTPYYKTWWFIVLTILLILGALYILYRYRIKQVLKLERLRTRIASDLHDDIGSTLSSISILSEILSQQLDESNKSAEMINKIGINARTMLESMDDIIWAVNPTNDKFQNLGLRIREFAIPLFESRNIRFHIQYSESLTLLKLTMDVRRNIYLIAKEAINNLVKYSDCTDAWIIFSEIHSSLVMTISDNGKGFDPENPNNRNGLKNMKRRAGQINAGFSIETSPGNGCKIILQVKII